MGELKFDRPYSVKDYLSILEKSAENKYEYVEGCLYAMAGGSIKLNQIGRNLIISIGSRLRTENDSCQVFGSDQKIGIKSRNSYLMPDISAVCGEIETDEEDENAIVNPLLIVEVLSKSTMGYEKTQKFSFYRTLSSLKEYMMIWQNDPIIESYKKLDDGSWEIASYRGLEQEVEFKSLGIKIPSSEIFKNLLGT